MKNTQLFAERWIMGAIAGCSLSIFSILTPVWAQSSGNTRAPIQFVQPTLENRSLDQLGDRGAPRRRTGAGTRGDCPPLAAGTPELTALVPMVQAGERGAIALGLTTEARPTFWVYIPYPQNTTNLRFVLLDETEKPVTEPVPLPPQTTPGIVGFRLPDSMPALEVGQYYRWYILVDCQPNGTSDTFVEAMVQRVAPSPALTRQLAGTTSENRMRLYAENSIWYDALTQLQTLRQQSPRNAELETAWVSLLQSIGLEQLGQ